MENNKILQLQGLRGFAMLGIFIFHTKTFISNDLDSTSDFIIMQLGMMGVITFFMLSGFLLIYKMKIIPVLTWRKRIYESRAKFHKLFLLYIITLIIAFLGKNNFPKSFSDWCFSLFCLPFNLTYTQDLIPLVNINISLNGPSWYISAMFIIWIITFTFAEKINKIKFLSKRVCFIGILSIIAIQILYKFLEFIFPTNLIPINHSDIYMSWISYYSPFYNFGFFILGCFIGRLAILHNTISMTSIYKTLVIIFILFFVFVVYNSDSFKYCKPILFEIFISLILLTIMSPKSLLGNILSIKPLLWIGNISASFFLIHGAVNYNLRYVEDYIEKPTLFFISLFLTLGLSFLSEKYLILNKNESLLQRIRKIA